LTAQKAYAILDVLNAELREPRETKNNKKVRVATRGLVAMLKVGDKNACKN
jgi:hypothetical protein